MPHLSIAISTKAEIFFRRNNFVAISTIQVCMETSMKLAIHMSPPSILVNLMHRRNYDEISSQYQRKNVAITMKLHRNWDEKLCQANNLRRSCWMCDESPSQLATKLRGNINECYISKPYLQQTFCICDETSWKSATKFCRYSDGYGKKVKKFRRNSVDIAIMTVGFKKKNYMKYGITILHCNMVCHITM